MYALNEASSLRLHDLAWHFPPGLVRARETKPELSARFVYLFPCLYRRGLGIVASRSPCTESNITFPGVPQARTTVESDSHAVTCFSSSIYYPTCRMFSALCGQCSRKISNDALASALASPEASASNTCPTTQRRGEPRATLEKKSYPCRRRRREKKLDTCKRITQPPPPPHSTTLDHSGGRSN